LVWSTFPDVETTRRIARQLVTENLAACANIVPAVDSIYRWEGKIESAQEALAFFKTTVTGYPAFQVRLKALHPYDVPEIICVRFQPGLAVFIRHSYDIRFRRLAIMSDRPGCRSAGENKDKRCHLAPASSQISCGDQAEQSYGQAVNRQGIEQDVQILRLVKIA